MKTILTCIKRRLFPPKLQQEIPMHDVQLGAKQLNRAVQKLSEQVAVIREERNDMSILLDDVLKKVSRRRRR